MSKSNRVGNAVATEFSFHLLFSNCFSVRPRPIYLTFSAHNASSVNMMYVIAMSASLSLCQNFRTSPKGATSLPDQG